MIKIFFTNHFFDQYRKRIDPKANNSEIKRRCCGRIKTRYTSVGLITNKNGDFTAKIAKNVLAICKPVNNGLLAITIVKLKKGGVQNNKGNSSKNPAKTT